MECPHCNKRLEFIPQIDSNCRIYGGSPKGKTGCCGKILQMERIITFKITIPENHDDILEDDWGNKIEK